jgi:hypothetical protein
MSVKCALTTILVGEASTLEEAWALLPASGEGVLLLADRVCRFDPGQRAGLLLEADVAEASSTTLLRQSGTGWKAWRWTEGPGDSHQYSEQLYLSSEPGEDPARLVYRQYWGQAKDDGIDVWTPLGSRFCGFERKR